MLGLVGEGSVHSNIDHLYALLHFAKENQLTNVFLHLATDGRDSPPKAAIELIPLIEEKIKQLGVGKIASIMGRYYAMDRDRRWERIEKAYFCLTKGTGKKTATALEAITSEYASNKTDEFIEPTNIVEDNTPLGLIGGGDAVIFYNFRIDRPRELTKAFVLENFEQEANKSLSFDPYSVKYYKTHHPQEQAVNVPFVRGAKIPDLFFATMTEYEKGLPVEVAFPPSSVSVPLGRVFSDQGLPQLRMAESEKERFVTFYFNGQREEPFPNEDRIILPSPKVPTYDMKPEMAAYELTEVLIQKMYEDKYPFILINFANADMVGHTGNIDASKAAIMALDNCLFKISMAAINSDYALFITADHGNVEQKINPQTGQISTEHTSNPVPFVMIHKNYHGKRTHFQSGILADVAPTILHYLGINKPDEMTGRNLLQEIM